MELERVINRVAFVVSGMMAGAMLAIGLILGFIPLEVVSSQCGSAFKGGNPFLVSPACDELRSLLRAFAWSALVIGVALGMAASVFAPTKIRAAPPVAAAE